MAVLDEIPAELGRVGGGPPAVDPQLLADKVFIRDVDAPRFAQPGQPVRLAITVEGKAPPAADAEGILEVVNNVTGEVTRIPGTGTFAIGDGTRQVKTATLEMPDGTLPVDIRALERDPSVDRVTNSQTITIRAATGASAPALNLATEFGPWVLGGAGVGLGAAQLSGRPTVPATAIGAGVGLGAKVASGQLAGPILPEFPTEEVLAASALFGTAAVLLSVSGIGRITRGIGGVTSGVGGAARRLGRR